MLLTAKRLCLFSPHAVALFSAFWKPIKGENEKSLERYIPRPAGLIPIDAISAPSEVNAPAIDIERAVPKPKLTCERVNISLPIIPSWSIIRPPNLYCACATFIDTTAITAANVKEKIFFIFAHYF